MLIFLPYVPVGEGGYLKLNIVLKFADVILYSLYIYLAKLCISYGTYDVILLLVRGSLKDTCHTIKGSSTPQLLLQKVVQLKWTNFTSCSATM